MQRGSEEIYEIQEKLEYGGIENEKENGTLYANPGEINGVYQ
jgi:hypothetical protein